MFILYAVCAVLSSWWWTENPSETCRASYRHKLIEKRWMVYFIRPPLYNNVVQCLYYTLYVQFWAPDDGRKNRLKHVERLTDINKLWKIASYWLYSASILATHGPVNVKSLVNVSSVEWMASPRVAYTLKGVTRCWFLLLDDQKNCWATGKFANGLNRNVIRNFW